MCEVIYRDNINVMVLQLLVLNNGVCIYECMRSSNNICMECCKNGLDDNFLQIQKLKKKNEHFKNHYHLTCLFQDIIVV